MLDATTSVGAVLGARGPGRQRAEELEVLESEGGDVGTKGAGAQGSPICSIGGGCSSVVISAAG